MESLPPEILRIILANTNLPVMRCVSRRFNQLGSVLLLESKTRNLRGLIARMMTVVAEKTNRLLDRENAQLALVLKNSDELAQLDKEVSALELRVREKQSSVDLLLGAALPPAQAEQLLRLCDLHAEFVGFAGIRQRVMAVSKALLEERDYRGDDREGLGWGGVQAPPRPRVPQPRRDPALPHGFDPYGEPDPDHFRWRQDDDEIPDYPGLYGPPGGNDP